MIPFVRDAREKLNGMILRCKSVIRKKRQMDRFAHCTAKRDDESIILNQFDVYPVRS